MGRLEFCDFEDLERRSASKGKPDSLRHPKRCDNWKSRLAHLKESEKPVTALAGLAVVLEGVELVFDEFCPSLLALRPPTSHRNCTCHVCFGELCVANLLTCVQWHTFYQQAAVQTKKTCTQLRVHALFLMSGAHALEPPD